MKSAKKIYKEHYYKNFNTNRDDEPMDWEINAMMDYASQSKWITIDVNDEKTLPEYTPTQWSKNVLCCNEKGEQWVDSGFFTTKEPHILIFWSSRRKDHTHWQPLPEKPAPSNNNKV